MERGAIVMAGNRSDLMHDDVRKRLASLLLLIVVAAVFGPSLVPYDLLMTQASQQLQRPSWKHVFV